VTYKYTITETHNGCRKPILSIINAKIKPVLPIAVVDTATCYQQSQLSLSS